MMIPKQYIRPAYARGAIENDWLQARFSFSFADYHDPNHVHWGSLRALNDDVVAPGHGFDWHAHHDIETITYPINGQIHHTDSLGNDYTFGRGQLLRMSAGSGISHSEMNASDHVEERHLQIWFYPRQRGHPPSCELVEIDEASKRNRWRVVASPDGRDGSATVQQNAIMHASTLSQGVELTYQLDSHRLGYLHVVSGEITVGPSLVLLSGDGLRFTDEGKLTLTALSPNAELLLFDL